MGITPLCLHHLSWSLSLWSMWLFKRDSQDSRRIVLDPTPPSNNCVSLTSCFSLLWATASSSLTSAYVRCGYGFEIIYRWSLCLWSTEPLGRLLHKAENRGRPFTHWSLAHFPLCLPHILTYLTEFDVTRLEQIMIWNPCISMASCAVLVCVSWSNSLNPSLL